MLGDSRGVPCSTSSAEALAACELAVDQLARYAGNPLDAAQAALTHDPDCVAARCVQAGVIVTLTERGMEPELRRAVEAGEALSRIANPRERMHLAAARAWLEGDFAGAVNRYSRLAQEYPRDLLAVQVTHLGDFYLGRQAGLRDHVAQVLHAWDPSVPGYAHLLGMYAFGLEENGDHGAAEEVGRRAVELEPRDAWASHAVAHVMEMQARLGEGMRWLRETSRGWEADNAFQFHNWWHLALYHADAGDVGAALALYDERIRPGRSDVALEMIDAAALLWRLQLRGHDVRSRWEELAEDWARRIDDGYYAFNDAHALMALLGAGRAADASRLLAGLEARAAGVGTNAAMTREVGLPLCRALWAFSRGDHAACVDGILAIRDHAVRFGGSNAQRDVLSLTAAEAALRGGLSAVALALASERVRNRPANPAGWVLLARALEQLGDRDGAADARARAESLRPAAAGGAGAGLQGSP